MAWHGPTERGEVLWERRGTCWNNLSLLYVWAVTSTSSKPGDGKSRKTCLVPQKNKALCFPRESLGLTWGEWSLREQKPRRCSLSGQCSLVANHLGRQPQVVTDRMQRHEDAVVRLWWPPWVLGGCAPLGHLLWWKLQQVSPFQGYSQYQRWFKKQVDFSLQCNCCNNLCF